MPLNNSFYGVYKFGLIRTKRNSTAAKYPYVIKSIKVGDSMNASAKFFMQGGPQTKIMDIGATKQEFSVSAPILVTETSRAQTGDLLDGLQLFWDICDLQYDSTNNYLPTNNLPLMTSASVSIGADQSSIDFSLLSDGDPNNSLNTYEIAYGTTAQSYITTTGINNAARVASNYDFFVDFGGLKYYVDSAKIDIKVTNTEKKFLGVFQDGTINNDYVVPQDGLNGGVYTPIDPTYSGWQFPFVAVGGVEITATGSATISISDIDGTKTNYKYNSTAQTTVQDLLAASNVTLQESGVLVTTAENFNIYFSGRGLTWTPGQLSAVLPPVFGNTNKAIITMNNYSFSEGDMKTDFTVKIFVGV